MGRGLLSRKRPAPGQDRVVTFLTKRYFDVVGADGAWAVAYDASIEYRGLALSYRELTGTGVPPGCRRFHLGRARTPFFGFREAAAYWEGGEVAHDMRVENAGLIWRLTHLRSEAHVKAPAAGFAGLGYGEELILKEPPWNLGIQEFWWGRYLSKDIFVTWIVAEGSSPIRFGLADGEASLRVQAGKDGASVGGVAIEYLGVKYRVSSGDALAGRPKILTTLQRYIGGKRFRIDQNKAVFACRVTTPGRQEEGFVLSEHGKITAV